MFDRTYSNNIGASECLGCPIGKNIADDGKDPSFHDELPDCYQMCPGGQAPNFHDNGCEMCDLNRYSIGGTKERLNCGNGFLVSEDKTQCIKDEGAMSFNDGSAAVGFAAGASIVGLASFFYFRFKMNGGKKEDRGKPMVAVELGAKGVKSGMI